MDLSLATDPYSNAYLAHNHYQQQQQQQQQQHSQQQQQHHHLQYQYHQSQHPQALSLAPPSGKGFYDLESLEHAGSLGAAPNSLGLGHLGSSSSYQPDYGLSTYNAGNPASSSAAGASYHHSMIPSHSPGQPWSRNSHSANLSAAQHSHYSPLGAAATPTASAAHMLHSTGYNAEAHGASAGVDHSLQYSSLHGWVGSEAPRSQWSQQTWDNCLPPGVEPTASSVSNSMLASHPHTHTQVQAHPHPQQYSQAHLQMYRHLQQYPSMNVWSKPTSKVWPKKKSANTAAKKIPVVKTTVMKESGASRGRAPENGPGWCSVCQRNCVTEVALKQHLDGKGHKRQVELQKAKAELAVKAVDADGGGVATMLEQMWVQVSMMGKTARVGKARKKPKAEGEPKDVKSTGLESKAVGELVDARPANIKPKAEEGLTNLKSTHAKPSNTTKGQETVRCDMCDVECNSRAVLEIHFGGKKHAARLKKLQESAVPCNAEQITSFPL